MIEAGQTLAHYRLTEKIGEGGMGEVWLARDVRPDRDVAVKVVATHNADPVSVERFNNEARAIASLSHPNILRVHDFGEDKDFSYLIMEYLTDGPHQRRRVRQSQRVDKGSKRGSGKATTRTG